MYILKEGRKSFLEFLRNLTPQVMIFTIVLLVSAKLDLQKFDHSNLKQSSIFFLLLAIWLCAVIANTKEFLGGARVNFKPIDDKSKELLRQGYKNIAWQLRICKYIWQEHKTLFIELFLVLAVAELGVVAVLITSIKSAERMLR
jgi:hypothetical protein